jgi:hypothetical protein
MTTAKKLAMIAGGYCLAAVCGFAAVVIDDQLGPSEIRDASSGMFAFRGMVLFILVTGALSLPLTCFLLKMCAEKAPAALLAIFALIATSGPLSWLAATWAPDGSSFPGAASLFGGALGLIIVFGAIPRMVAGPIVLMIEGATFFRARDPRARALLVVAMLMDLVPLGWFAMHMAAAIA